MTSHAALVARGFGIPTVAGCSDISVGANFFTVNGKTIKEGDPISLNGTLGRSHRRHCGSGGPGDDRRVRHPPELGR